MEKDKIEDDIKSLLKARLGVEIEDPDENFFSRDIHISPIDMVCLLKEMSEIFHIQINDSFIEKLPYITLNKLTEAFYLSVR